MMWGKNKLEQNKQPISRRAGKLKKICLAGGVFLVLTLVATLALSPKVALANADDGLKAEVYQFKIAQKIKACQRLIGGLAANPLFSYPIGGRADYLMNVLAGLHDTLPHDEGVFKPEESRKQYLCDVRALAEQNGHGDFFAKYFLEHGQFSDNPSESQLVMTDVANHTASNVKDKLRRNELSDVVVRGLLVYQAIGAYPSPQLSKGAIAQLLREALRFCAKDPDNPFTEGDGDYKFVVKGDDGKYVVKKGYFTYMNGADAKRELSMWASNHEAGPYGGPDTNCATLLFSYSQLADEYAAALNKYLEEHPDDPDTTPSDSADTTDEDDNTCQKELKGLGYILCPGVSVISDMIDNLYTFFGGFLEWTFLSGSSGKNIQSYWSKFLAIANIALVIAFLLIIYSTATSTGLSNYDIKKMLPRLLLFAVVINVSFYICAAIADLSNIAGKGAYSMLAGMKKIGDSGAQSLFMKAITNLFGVGAILFIVFGLSFGITILISLITIIIAISVRNLGLALLVIVSPIAFALYLFPNESIQRWGRRWLDMFVKMIVVYPVFMVVAGGSSLIRDIGGDVGAGLPIITELACAALPALSIIPLFKMSGDVMGRATSLVHGSKATAAVAAAGHNALVNSKVGQGMGNIRAGLLQRAQNRFGDVPLIGGALRSDGVNKAIGAVDKQRNALDQQAMENANDKIARMSDGQLQEAFLNGTVGGRQVTDTHTMRAIIAKQAPNADMAQSEQAMRSINDRANWLQSHGREREAGELRHAYADAMIANGKSGLSASTLQSWATNGWSGEQFSANYANAVASYASGLSPQAQADMSAANLIQMRQTLQNSGANGGNVATADAGIRNVADQANVALSNPEVLAKMSNATRSALRDNSLLRSTAGQGLANTHKLANVYHDYNSGGANAAAAATRARSLMSHADFSRMDTIDQSRIRTIAGSGSTGRTMPVQIASWDRRLP